MTSALIAKDKDIVAPGEDLAKGMDFLPSSGTYRDGENIVSEVTGLLKVEGKVLKVLPLAGDYLPKRGDTIIGQVSDIAYSGWTIDTFSPYQAMLGLKDATSEFVPRGADLTQYFNIGDFIVVKIFNITSQNLIDVTTKGPGLRKLGKGRIVKVNSHKVPRVIGKQGSMVVLIKQHTNTQIVVGQNGVVWVSGEDPALENVAVEAIKKIESEAHKSGLTEEMEKWIKAKVKK